MRAACQELTATSSGFGCACELAQALLDLLVASLRSSPAGFGGDGDGEGARGGGTSPMSLAVQLVTAITVMQKYNGESPVWFLAIESSRFC